jgi:hypothetical protein
VDGNVAPNYVRANFELSDRLAVVVLNKQTGGVIQRITTAEQIAAPGFQAWLRYHNAQRSEIYISMNALRSGAMGRTKADVETIRHVYLDFDQNATEAVDNLLRRRDLPHPNFRINTSPGKWQVVWKVEAFTPELAEILQKSLARELGADTAATDCARVLRLPGFNNHKYPQPHVVTVESLSESIHRPDHFPRPPVERDPSAKRATRAQMRSARKGLSQSERDFAFAKRALFRGISEQAVIAAIAAFRSDDKPNPRYYAELTVRKATQAREQLLQVGHSAEPER